MNFGKLKISLRFLLGKSQCCVSFTIVEYLSFCVYLLKTSYNSVNVRCTSNSVKYKVRITVSSPSLLKKFSVIVITPIYQSLFQMESHKKSDNQLGKVKYFISGLVSWFCRRRRCCCGAYKYFVKCHCECLCTERFLSPSSPNSSIFHYNFCSKKKS